MSSKKARMASASPTMIQRCRSGRNCWATGFEGAASLSNVEKTSTVQLSGTDRRSEADQNVAFVVRSKQNLFPPLGSEIQIFRKSIWTDSRGESLA